MRRGLFIVSTTYIMLVPVLEVIVKVDTAGYFAIVTVFSMTNYFICRVPEMETKKESFER